jgi:hypothetical protein
MTNGHKEWIIFVLRVIHESLRGRQDAFSHADVNHSRAELGSALRPAMRRVGVFQGQEPIGRLMRKQGLLNTPGRRKRHNTGQPRSHAINESLHAFAAS